MEFDQAAQVSTDVSDVSVETAEEMPAPSQEEKTLAPETVTEVTEPQQRIAPSEMPSPEGISEITPGIEVEKVASPNDIASQPFIERIKPIRFPDVEDVYTIASWMDDHTVQIEVRQDDPTGSLSHLLGMYAYDVNTGQIMEYDVVTDTFQSFPG